MLFTNKPRHTHDCLSCRYLGSVDGSNPYHEGRLYQWDLYFCARAESDLEGSVIARSASEASEYMSMPRALIRRCLMEGHAPHPALLWGHALLDMEERNESRK